MVSAREIRCGWHHAYHLQPHPGWSAVTSIPVRRYWVTRLCHFVLDVDRGSLTLAHHQPVCGRVTSALLFKWCCANFFFPLGFYFILFFFWPAHLLLFSSGVTWVNKFNFLKILNTDTLIFITFPLKWLCGRKWKTLKYVPLLSCAIVVFIFLRKKLPAFFCVCAYTFY